MTQLDEMVARKEEVEAHYLGLPGVRAVDVGYKEVGGQLTDQLAIRVHVAKKKPRVTAAEKIPAQIDGVVTDVLERDYELQVAVESIDVSAQADTTHYATLQGGISMGPSRVINGSIFAGTLGAIVVDNASNKHAALTNFHVACVDSTWHVGDRMVQPSRIDTGTVPGDEFGSIARATLSGHVDGAVISIDPAKTSTCAIAEIGQVRGTKAASLGMAVRKRGRTTGLTYGSVDGVSATVNVDYGDGLGVHTLTNQVSVKADTTRNALFSDHGDSGSVIVDDSGFVVALLFAGAGAGTIGNPIAAVLSELNVGMCVGKSVLKDIKEGTKDLIKDKELHKDVVKDKELNKDVVKVKELNKDLVKDKELRKEVIPDNKGIKDVVDGKVLKRVPDLPPIPDPGPIEMGPTPVSFAERLSALESQLAALKSFISPGLRPDLSTSALSGEPDLSEEDIAALRSELAAQAEQAAAAKAEFDAPWT